MASLAGREPVRMPYASRLREALDGLPQFKALQCLGGGVSGLSAGFDTWFGAAAP